MKNIAAMFGVFFLGILVVACVMTSAGRSNREMELDDNLPSVVEETLAEVMEGKSYDITSENEIAADLAADLSKKLDSNCDITVNIENIDKEKGLVSVNVVAEYHHPDGKVGRITCERTVIFNKVQDVSPKLCRVTFLVDGKTYKSCRILQGDLVSVPVEPVADGKVFVEWTDENGNSVNFTDPVEQDQSYYAKFS